MDFLLLPFGSSGDVHPFIGLGKALQSRGHRVRILVNGYFMAVVRAAGLECIELGSAEDFLQMTLDPDLWHPMRGTKKVLESLSLFLPQIYDAIVEHSVRGKTTVISSTLGFSALMAQEKLGIPVVTVHLQPAVIRSSIAPPTLTGLWMPSWMPMWARHMEWSMVDLVIDQVMGRPIQQYRKTLGLPRIHGIMNQWFHSPLLTIGLFPEWFCPPQLDWPSQVKLTGFPLYDESDTAIIPAEVETFLQAGGAPIVFTPGSAMRHGKPFFTAAVDACVRLKKRGVLLSRFAENIPANLPENVKYFSYVPLSKILPRAAAMVHHGGIGTTSQCLAAGSPQLIMAMGHDQFDNAAHVQKVNAGDVIRVKDFRGDVLMKKLRNLLESPLIQSGAQTCALRLKNHDALEKTCELIEGVGIR